MHRCCSGQVRSGPYNGENLVVLSWNFLVFTGTFCHAFFDVPRLVQQFPQMGGPGHTGAVLGKTNLASLKVNIGLFSIGTPCCLLEPFVTHFLASLYWSRQFLEGAGQGTKVPFRAT